MANFDQISKFFETEYPLNKQGLKELFDAFEVKKVKMLDCQAITKSVYF